jgi:succinate dehydrogenase hydrophobic anchor subunit
VAVSQQRLDQTPAAGAPDEPISRNILGVSFIGQAISGAAVLGLITLHMIAQHFLVSTGIRDYADVVAWLGNPILVALEVLFLVFVTWHALLGVRAIIFDWGLSARAERIITRCFIVVGVATIAYGAWLLAVVVSRGQG